MVATISFPENVTSALAETRHRTLVYLLRLLRLSGYSVLVTYLACLFALKPVFKLNYDRRLEFMRYAYTKMAGIYSQLRAKAKHVPSVEIRYEGKIYKDEMISTDDDGLYQYSYTPYSTESKEVRFSVDYEDCNERSLRATDKVCGSLENLKRTLVGMDVAEYKKDDAYVGTHTFRTAADTSEMSPLLFQLKQLKNYMEMVNADHPCQFFFKRSPLQGLYSTSHSRKDNYIDNLFALVDECKELVEQAKMVK